jgi:hypothetical protein
VTKRHDRYWVVEKVGHSGEMGPETQTLVPSTGPERWPTCGAPVPTRNGSRAFSVI